MSLLEQAGWTAAVEREVDAARAAFVTGLVALATGVPPREIAETRRAPRAVRARQVALYLATVTFGWPLARAAAAFGRDRTTAALACRTVEDWREDAEVDARLSDLERCLRAAPEPKVFP